MGLPKALGLFPEVTRTLQNKSRARSWGPPQRQIQALQRKERGRRRLVGTQNPSAHLESGHRHAGSRYPPRTPSQPMPLPRVST